MEKPTKSKFVAFFDKTPVKIVYAFLAFTLAFIMFLIATNTGSIFDWAIFFLLVYMGLFDTVTVVRRLRRRPATHTDSKKEEDSER